MNTRITISITPELNSALTRAALDKNTNVSKQVEIYLRENHNIIKYIKEIESEDSMLAVSSKKQSSNSMVALGRSGKKSSSVELKRRIQKGKL